MDFADSFDALWQSGLWRKEGKVAAKRTFVAQIKTEEDWRLMQLAVREFNLSAKAQRQQNVERGIDPEAFIIHGSTFFGYGKLGGKNWRNYIPEDIVEIDERTEALEDEQSETATHRHYCKIHGHAWAHAGTATDCLYPGHMDCSVEAGAKKSAVSAGK